MIPLLAVLDPSAPTLTGRQIFWLCVLVGAIGAVGIGGIVYFGISLFRQTMSRSWFEFPYLGRLLDFWDKNNIRPNFPRYFSDAYSEMLGRRNEFWTTYGQIIVAALIIIVLTILLLTRTISAEAGLPILSAISGFAIAKGVSARGSSSGPDEQSKSG